MTGQADQQERRLPARASRLVRSWMGHTERNGSGPSSRLPDRCPSCQTAIANSPDARRWHVCPGCGRHFRISAYTRLSNLVDPDSFEERDARLDSRDPLRFADDRPYADRLRFHRERGQTHDAVITGTATIDGSEVVVAVLDFDFMGGSMGVVVGERITRVAEHAQRKRLPLITVAASGGARIQEGIFALQQMAKTAAAIKKLRMDGIPYLSVLTDPTTGGVFASFASLGDILLAEPGALIGFAGPRVAEQALGQPLPPGSHTAEHLLAHGHIDAVVPRPELRSTIAAIVAAWADTQQDGKPIDLPESAHWQVSAVASAISGWSAITESRHERRPTAMDYIDRMVTGFIELRGDRQFADDPAVVAGLGRMMSIPVAVIGFERGHGDERAARRGGQLLPEGFRKAHRIMSLAARWRIPVVTLIDTPGAWPGIEAEERGLAAAIAQNLALMSDLPTPIVAAFIGEGESGGALALSVADRVLMQERSVFPVISPEGAAAILFRDLSRAPEVAESLRITAPDLLALGIIDAIVREPEEGASADPDQAATFLQRAIVESLEEIRRAEIPNLLRQRHDRYRAIGSGSVRSATPPERAIGWVAGRLSPRRLLRRPRRQLQALPASIEAN